MIDQTLTTPPDAPSSNDIPTFRSRFDAFIAWIVTFVSQLTTVINEINSTASTINDKEESAVYAASAAIASANFQGTWTNQTTVIGQSWEFEGIIYRVLIAGNTSPTVSPLNWASIATASEALLALINEKAPLSSPVLTGTPTAPTPTYGDKSTKIATTDFVMNNPCFSAYRSSTQPISSSTWTKVQFNAEDYDPNNKYDSTTNFRFQPDVAGYYDLKSAINIQATSMTAGGIALYKNGSIAKMLDFSRFAATSLDINIHGTADLYLNGSTDYAEIYVQIIGTNPVINSGSPFTYFSAKFSRS